MSFSHGYFSHAAEHHRGWFRIFRFPQGLEVWVGNRWFSIDWTR